MYFAYIRLIFEYASVVWNSAPRHGYYFTTIEKLQIAAARIVTGTNTYASTGWEPQLILLYSIM